MILSKRLRWTTFDVRNGVAEVFQSLVEDAIEDTSYDTVLQGEEWNNWKAYSSGRIQDRREDFSYNAGLPERFRFLLTNTGLLFRT